MTISSGDGGVADWTAVNECITVGAVMSTCRTIDACSESGLGNIEGIGDFSVVKHPGECKVLFCIVGCICCHGCFCFLFLSLGILSPQPLTLLASTFQPALGLGVAWVLAVFAGCTRRGFLVALLLVSC